MPFGLTPGDLVAGLLLVALTAYALLAGADFGGGVWDMLATGPRKVAQRALIAEAISPVWEANHVWLILAVVILFTCFPPAYAHLSIALHIPLVLMLIGIVLRGTAFTFRSYDSQHHQAQRRWGRIFASASVVTPLILGIAIGAVASGRIGGPPSGTFIQAYVLRWFNPFCLSVGCFALALFAFLAATYLTVEAKTAELRDDFRVRALWAGAAVFATALVTLVLALRFAPLVGEGLMRSPRAVPIHLLTGAAAVTALAALWRRHWRIARLAAAAQVTLILWGWAFSQYPYLVPPTITVQNSVAPPVTIRIVLIALAVGAVVLVPSLVYLMKVFKGAHAE
ncbi:MAG: cytochrome d ubiquinol oxidase subunit II [Gemmatimonadota bacterium]